MALRGAPSPPGLKQSGPRRTSNLWTEPSAPTSLPVAADTGALETQIAQLTAQLATAEANLAVAEANLAIAQAQIDADTIEIATLDAQVAQLTSQVATLQAQVVALQNQLSKVFHVVLIDTLTTDAGGIYVPPSFNDETVTLTSIVKQSPRIINTITTTVGGYP